MAERDREVAVLRERLAEKSRHVEYLTGELERLQMEARLISKGRAASAGGYELSGPDLQGEVAAVSGEECSIAVTANPGNVDLQSVITRLPFRFAVYDEDGFKAEAVAIKYDATAKVVKCRLAFTKGGTVIVVGDKAATKP